MDVIILLIIAMACICPIAGIMLHIYALIEKKWNKKYKRILNGALGFYFVSSMSSIICVLMLLL